MRDESRSNWAKLFVVLLLSLRLLAPCFGQEAQPPAPSGPPKVVSVLGLENVKWNSTGTLAVQDDKLQFKSAKAQAEINTTSIRDVLTAEDSQRMLGGTVGTVTTIAAPYGSGRVISLFREKIDALTLEFGGEIYYFENEFDREMFRRDPGVYDYHGYQPFYGGDD